MKKIKLSKHQKIQCNSIIHTASVAAGTAGAGLAQIPLSDAAIITPIQVTMIVSLGAVFGFKITEKIATGIIGSCGTAFIGRGITQIVVGWIPGIGNIINTTTAAGLTEAIGWLAVKHFNENNKYEWKKEGYTEASHHYEIKFQKQADEFIKQKIVFANQMQEYEELIDVYDKRIQELEEKLDLSKEENNQLRELLVIRNKLIALPKNSS